jgi:SAM-dependent methyltransferase
MADLAVGPNAEQIEYWNAISGPKWVALRAAIDATIRPLGLLAMERAQLATGERVLDVGCGCGGSTVELARRVAPGGAVVGVDVSRPMLARARELAEAEGVAVRFELADAQQQAFVPASTDVVYSRFGVMFFADPVAAFVNVRRALRSAGRLAFVCWQALADNAWMSVPLAAALQVLPPHEIARPGAPGPFAFADPVRVRGILGQAGFVDVAFEDVRETLAVGGRSELDETIDFLLQMGPTGGALRAAEAGLAPRVAAAVREALAPYVTPAGVRMASAAWVVTARNP